MTAASLTAHQQRARAAGAALNAGTVTYEATPYAASITFGGVTLEMADGLRRNVKGGSAVISKALLATEPLNAKAITAVRGDTTITGFITEVADHGQSWFVRFAELPGR